LFPLFHHREVAVSHSFTNLLYHLVFSTKERRPWLDEQVRVPVCEYLGGLVRDEGGISLIVNGVADHVHLLVKLRQDKALSEVLRAIKAGSSGWIHRKFPGHEHFAWQTGYGAFTVSQSQVKRAREYIARQEEHHRNKPFRQELLEFLKAHEIDYNEEDLWD
jgi:REP element-mobilizing transposase RayT